MVATSSAELFAISFSSRCSTKHCQLNCGRASLVPIVKNVESFQGARSVIAGIIESSSSVVIASTIVLF
jgi:hypothetical protein